MSSSLKMRTIFDKTKIIIEGKPRRAARLYCYRCDKSAVTLLNTMTYSPGAEDKEERMIGRKFSDMGWQVDLGRGKHHCPECQLSPQVKAATEVEMASSIVQMPTTRAMTREDRRIIFEKLNEVYLDEKRGYEPPWTDEKVSVHLGTPRAWVAEVREELFGPVASNSDIDAAIVAGKELAAEISKYREQGDKLAHTAETIMKQLAQIMKAVGQ